jgi:hypothetical protein
MAAASPKVTADERGGTGSSPGPEIPTGPRSSVLLRRAEAGSTALREGTRSADLCWSAHWTALHDTSCHVRVSVEGLAVRLPQHPDQHPPKRPILLAVDQEFGEGADLRCDEASS